MIGKCIHYNGISKRSMHKLFDVGQYEIFCQTSDIKDLVYATKYVLHDDHMFMIPTNVDSAIKYLSTATDLSSEINRVFQETFERGFDLVSIGFAEYMGKLPEALEHNQKIEERRAKTKQEFENKKIAKAQAEAEAQLDRLTKAEENVKNGQSITAHSFLLLCDKYQVQIPHRTKGWARENLLHISTESVRHSGSKVSDRIFDIFAELEGKIKNA